MPKLERKRPPEYLREARVRAGYISRGTATTAVPFSQETIGRHERGDVELEPEDAVTYAECYKSPDILHRYCATCPVGQRIGRTATDRPLPHATLRIRRLIVDAQSVAERLEQIAFDGVIDDTERGFRKCPVFPPTAGGGNQRHHTLRPWKRKGRPRCNGSGLALKRRNN